MLDYVEVVPGPGGTQDNITDPFFDLHIRLFLIKNLTAESAAIKSGQADLISNALTSVLGLFITWVGSLYVNGEHMGTVIDADFNRPCQH